MATVLVVGELPERFTAEVSRPALSSDLSLQAWAGAVDNPANYQVEDFIGDPCAGAGFSLRCHDGDPHYGDEGGGSGVDPADASDGCSCNAASASPGSAGIALARRRRPRAS